MTNEHATKTTGQQVERVRCLSDHLPQYRAALDAYAQAITENAHATKNRDQATDALADARAQAQDKTDPDQPREFRAAAVHVATMSALLPFRAARDRHTDTAAELERTYALERGGREILRALRVIVQVQAGGETE